MIASLARESSNSTDFSQIRRASPADAEQIISGINRICAEGDAFYTTRFVTTSRWDTVLHRPKTVSDHLLLVAEWNGQFVGAGRLFRGGKYTLFKHVAELGIFVLKPFRRRGVGAQLLAQLAEWAVQSDIEKITLVVFSTNKPAIQFFEKHGFIQEGRMHRQIKTEEKYIDLLSMGKFLSSTDES